MSRIHSTADLKIGDEVGVAGSHEYQTRVVKVAHKTPTGRVTTADGVVFNPKGEETGDGRLRLYTADAIRRLREAKQELRDRANRAHAFKTRVEALIRGKTNGLGEVCGEFTADEKAELVKLIEAL